MTRLREPNPGRQKSKYRLCRGKTHWLHGFGTFTSASRAGLVEAFLILESLRGLTQFAPHDPDTRNECNSEKCEN